VLNSVTAEYLCLMMWMWHRFTNVLWLQVFDMLIGVVIMMWLLHDSNALDMSDQLLTSAHVCCTAVRRLQLDL